MFKTQVATLTSAMVTEYASELVVKVALHLENDMETCRLIPEDIRHLQETPSLMAIQQMKWEFPLSRDGVAGEPQSLTFTDAEWEKVVIYYKECTRALFKRRPWIPDHKPFLQSSLVRVDGHRVTWKTKRSITTTTHDADLNTKDMPAGHHEPVAPDD